MRSKYIVFGIVVAAFLFGSAFSYALSDVLDSAKIKSVAQSSKWLRLLHFNRSFPFFTLKSQADGRDFFLSPDGDHDAEAELIATLKSFSQDLKVGRMKQHPQCAFPERYNFLKKEFHLDTKDVDCPQLKEFLDRFNAESTTLVFSSAYPNNPASMFGHTFLRINAKAPLDQANTKLDMLDHGVSFAAGVGDQNGVLFAFLGLTGGYIGQFSFLPYYAKVNEYNNSESRDIWEYDLSLTTSETLSLLRHLWELETTTYFDYYFFDENCAYMLLALLESAKPEWKLLPFPLYAIPGETVKRVANIEGAVTRVKFRASLRKKMMQRYQALKEFSGSGLQEFLGLIRKEMPVEIATDVFALDTASAYLMYQKQEKDDKFPEDQRILLKAVLAKRAELGNSATASELEKRMPPIVEDSRPDKAHNPLRLSTSSGFMKERWNSNQDWHYFQDLQFKFMVHDFLNRDDGYTKFSDIEFPGMTLRYQPDRGKLGIETLDGIIIKSLFPTTFIEKRPSWTASFRYQTAHDLENCEYCHVLNGELGAGAAFEVFNRNYAIYAMLLGDLDLGSALSHWFRIGPRIETSFVANPIPQYKTQLAALVATDFFQSGRQKAWYRFEWSQAFSISRYIEVRSSFAYYLSSSALRRIYDEMKLSANFLF